MSMATTFLFSSSSLLLSEAFMDSDFNVGIVLYLIVGLVLLYEMYIVQISHVNYPTSPMIYKFLLMGS